MSFPALLGWTLIASAVLLVALPICLYLSLSTRAALRGLEEAAAPKRETAEQINSCSAAVDKLKLQIAGLEKICSAPGVGRTSPPGSLNLNRKGQVLRLHRRGESVRDIAAALRVCEGEVKLILKVYEWSRELPSTKSSREASIREQAVR